MPGAYAHITLVNLAHKRAEEAGISPATAYALLANLKYVELGAVSPDYPYLASGEAKWADLMHYTDTSTLVREGVRSVAALPANSRDKGVAWLFGYVAHMTADMTIHPIVEKIVGPYQGNKAAHRECEMHQDAHIFGRLDLGDAGVSQHLASGIADCGEGSSSTRLDAVVTGVWGKMLSKAYAAQVAQGAPQYDDWHVGFTTVLRAMGGANRLFPFARHVAAGLNLAYPTPDKVSAQFVQNLPTPEGPLSYDALFDRAQENVLRVWKEIDAQLAGTQSAFLTNLEDWNLDTGRSVQTREYVFWKN